MVRTICCDHRWHAILFLYAYAHSLKRRKKENDAISRAIFLKRFTHGAALSIILRYGGFIHSPYAMPHSLCIRECVYWDAGRDGNIFIIKLVEIGEICRGRFVFHRRAQLCELVWSRYSIDFYQTYKEDDIFGGWDLSNLRNPLSRDSHHTSMGIPSRIPGAFRNWIVLPLV